MSASGARQKPDPRVFYSAAPSICSRRKALARLHSAAQSQPGLNQNSPVKRRTPMFRAARRQLG